MVKEVESPTPDSTPIRSNRTIVDIKTPSDASSQHLSSNISSKKSDKNTSIKKLPPTKKLSAIKLRRAKYLVQSKNDGALTKGSKTRNDMTMSKLSTFSSRMFQAKSAKNRKISEKVSNGKDSSDFLGDNSLTTRVDRRDKL